MDKVTVKMIEDFLYDVDKDFPVNLSKKVDLENYAKKLYEKATICCEIDDNMIIGMVAGYTDNIVDDMAYISLVGVRENYRGNGIASKLINRFVNIAKNKNINKIHVYTDSRNKNAISMYINLGFKLFNCANELRPNDKHYILKFIEKQDFRGDKYDYSNS